MTSRVNDFVAALEKQMNSNPKDLVHVHITPEMAKELIVSLDDGDKKRHKNDFRHPSAIEVADEIQKCVNEQISPDIHTLLWAEYWLRYAKANCVDPSKLL